MAHLHFGSLSKKHNRRALLTALETLPKELNDTYNEVLKRILSQDEEDAELAKRVLGWLLYAKRPLTTRELQHALSVTPDSGELDEAALTEEADLISVCAGIVTVERETSIIRWVHYTTQEYFQRIGLPGAQADIAISCLTYLSYDTFENLCGSYVSLRERELNYPFGWYAAKFWGVHARDVEKMASVQDRALAFLSNEKKRHSMREMRLQCGPQEVYYFKPENLPLLPTLAEEGLVTIFSLIKEQGSNTEDRYLPDKLLDVN